MYKVGDRVVWMGKRSGTVTRISNDPNLYRYITLQMDDGSIRYAEGYYLTKLA